MKSLHRGMVDTITMLVGMLLLLLAASACSGGGGDKAVALLEDPEVGLASISDQLQTANGSTNGTNLLNDPKVGLAHLNEEAHTLKQLLADLSQQVEALSVQIQQLQTQ